ncbi:MAG TPA: DNA mismatch repair endonuclease MutL, partial [Leptospiraceae bacterium]|nr:DNA mismatch repair endonuclease MutL [Leptospiraceae bacterium]
MAEKQIRRLPSIVIDRIAAGEVIESPASVIKELSENSLDAGATRLRIETTAGGMDSLVVEDDGSGIPFHDLPAAIERHATSKIGSIEDIENILSFGFRGEALASIASVSLLRLTSRTRNEEIGGILESRAGTISLHERKACSYGTVVQVRDLFFATPARKKFIKSEKTENLKIYREIRKIALSSPNVEILYIRDGQEYLHFARRNTLRERLADVFPSDALDRWIEIHAESDGISVFGFISSPDAVRANRDNQLTFVNGRWVELKYMSYLLKKGYGDLIAHGMHPSAVIHFTIQPDMIDVNVHPAKREIRFLDENRLQGLVIRAIQRALSAGPVVFSEQTLQRNFREVSSNPLSVESLSP